MLNHIGTPSAEELAVIRAMAACDDLAAEELFVFPLVLATDSVDRDGERFTAATLRELAPMFLGKTGIFDHEWSAHGQTARLFECEVVENGGVTELRGRAYMLREGNETLVREIEAGIKREVSVGCAVKQRRCSICGDVSGACAHKPGRRYGGELCVRELIGAADAYEWSFVAVPAQTLAGVRKTCGAASTAVDACGAGLSGSCREGLSRTGSLPCSDRRRADYARPHAPQLVRAHERAANLDCYRI